MEGKDSQKLEVAEAGFANEAPKQDLFEDVKPQSILKKPTVRKNKKVKSLKDVNPIQEYKQATAVCQLITCVMAIFWFVNSALGLYIAETEFKEYM